MKRCLLSRGGWLGGWSCRRALSFLAVRCEAVAQDELVCELLRVHCAPRTGECACARVEACVQAACLRHTNDDGVQEAATLELGRHLASKLCARHLLLCHVTPVRVDVVEQDLHVAVRRWKSHGAKHLAQLGAQRPDLLRLVDVKFVHVERLPEHPAAVLVKDVDAVVQARLSPTRSRRLTRVEARHLVHLDTTL